MLRRKVVFFTISLLLLFHSVSGQSGFNFYESDSDRIRVRFQLINNLVVFPIEINGKQLSFILDTGVTKTILFTLKNTDSLLIKNVERTTLSGLGKGLPVKALLAKKNTFNVKGMKSKDEDLYVITESAIDLSSKMGTTVHGIIGYNLLKDVVVKIDYKNRYLEFINPKVYTPTKCKKCEDFPIQIYNKKPFIEGQIVTQDADSKRQSIDVKLLVDSGGSDALWLFENSKSSIKPPKLFFNDVLGEGLSGTIYGKRSRVQGFKLGKYFIKEPTVSYLDSASTVKALQFKDRNGSVGGDVLKRFKVWIDYPNKKITLKQTASLSSGFNYNMSGLTIAYNGKTLVKMQEDSRFSSTGINSQSSLSGGITIFSNYKFMFLPVYRIDNVIPDSPAGLAGIQKGDIIVSINYKDAYNYDLQDIMNLFQSKNNRKITMKIKREGKPMKFKFNLKRKI